MTDDRMPAGAGPDHAAVPPLVPGRAGAVATCLHAGAHGDRPAIVLARVQAQPAPAGTR